MAKLWLFAVAAPLLLALPHSFAQQGQRGRSIPSYIKVCRQSNPNIEECIKNSIEKLRPYLVKGIPEFNIPSIEPLYIKTINANQGQSLKITLKDVKAYGCSDFVINRLKMDLKSMSMDFGLNLPHLYIESNYEVDGKILLLPIRGRGPFTGNFTNCKGDVILRGGLEKRGGKDYLKYKSMDINIHVGRGKMQLENLFGGDKMLGKIVNDAINANFDQFRKELKPQIEKAISSVMLDSANQIVQHFPYSELFPK
ncbi:circadian clock-controlled protein daywake-like [Ischnura elegans]|uniref:circadian clock-controlled protein daywake-like n=1 Tax=Ischnura elegans TaxID=197161 RepID=UPI001ED86C09|nr:circadian clock-controlled protein daywake-like [Ischnura elegans]